MPIFNKKYLQKLVQIIGCPLKVDAATSELKRPSAARVLVEIDAAKSPINIIWMSDEDYGFWQHIECENCPAFCTFCKRVGHADLECFRKDPSPKTFWPVNPVTKPKELKQMSIPKAGLDKEINRG